MSEELEELARKFKNRTLSIFHALVFVVGVLGIWIPIITVVGYLTDRLLIGLPVTFGYSALFFIIFTMIREPVKKKLAMIIRQETSGWEMQAIEDTIKTIESSAPVSIASIESYSQDLLHQRLANEYPNINLKALNVIHPITDDALKKLLAQQPFLGTYHPVEQFFIKNV